MAAIFVPAKGRDDWKALLAKPEEQWKVGYSARALASCWHEAGGFPPLVHGTLAKSGHSALQHLEMLIGLPEHKVALPPDGGRPSQTDIWVLARGSDGLVSIAVEGKVVEPFGPTVAEWLQSDSKGKTDRMKFICTQLGVDSAPGHIRYQLLHRTVSAVLEAKRFTAGHAVKLVQSFSQRDEGFKDYQEFGALFDAVPMVNGVVASAREIGVRLYFGWVRDDERYLKI